MTLEHVKSKAAHLEAFFVSCFGALKNVPYMHCRDVSTESVRYFWTAMHDFIAEIDLLKVTLKDLKINKERMLQSAKSNFCTVTELANYLVRKDEISFREAHEIVAHLVGYMNEHKKRADEITIEELNGFCQEMFGFTSKMTQDDVNNALDPVKNAQSKVCIGGSAAQEVTRQLDLIEATIEKDQSILAARNEKVKAAKDLLEKEVTKACA